MVTYDQSKYHVDFSDHTNLTDAEKMALETIQQQYRPLERINFLIEYIIMGKINNDEFETMTGTPYEFSQ